MRQGEKEGIRQNKQERIAQEGKPMCLLTKMKTLNAWEKKETRACTQLLDVVGDSLVNIVKPTEGDDIEERVSIEVAERIRHLKVSDCQKQYTYRTPPTTTKIKQVSGKQTTPPTRETADQPLVHRARHGPTPAQPDEPLQRFERTAEWAYTYTHREI
jgi:hypothetical protein